LGWIAAIRSASRHQYAQYKRLVILSKFDRRRASRGIAAAFLLKPVIDRKTAFASGSLPGKFIVMQHKKIY
jgi:hypothetical protein